MSYESFDTTSLGLTDVDDYLKLVGKEDFDIGLSLYIQGEKVVTEFHDRKCAFDLNLMHLINILQSSTVILLVNLRGSGRSIAACSGLKMSTSWGFVSHRWGM